MSNSILEALFHGKIDPWGRELMHSPKRIELVQKIQDEKAYFTGKMSDDERKRFERLEDLYGLANEDDEADIFAHGFTLGVLIMQAVWDRWEGIANEQV